MFTGSLPWKGIFAKRALSKWEKVYIIKSSQNLKNLCQSCPKEFENYLNIVRKLKVNENPDYNYLKTLILNTISINNLNRFIWDKRKRTLSTKKPFRREKLVRTKTEKIVIKSEVNEPIMKQKTSIQPDARSGIFCPSTLTEDGLPEFKNRAFVMELRNVFHNELESTRKKMAESKCIVA
jgi:hypothetical protein